VGIKRERVFDVPGSPVGEIPVRDLALERLALELDPTIDFARENLERLEKKD